MTALSFLAGYFCAIATFLFLSDAINRKREREMFRSVLRKIDDDHEQRKRAKHRPAPPVKLRIVD